METRGRKPLPEGKRKAPQATVKINDFILPFVKELKGNLKKGVVTGDTLSQLFFVLQGEAEQQASIFKDASAIGIIEELQEKIHLLEAGLRIKDNKIISLNNSLKEKMVTPVTESERGLLKKQ